MTATETACEPHVRRHALRWRGHAWAAALLGWVLGTALQVQQPVLWAAGVYIGVTVFAFALTLLAWRARPGAARALGWLLAAALAAFGTTGWRATMMLAERLTPSLEGRDVLLTGTVSRMPQKSEAGWRFRFDV